MATYIINNGSGLIIELYEALANKNPKIIDKDDIKHLKTDKNDLIILSGGGNPGVLWHKKDYADETRLIKKHKGPIIGICFGFELIAHTYNCHMHLLDRKEHGIRTITRTNNLFNIPDEFPAYESHIWGVKDINSNFTQIARSKNCIEIIKHRTKPIIGLQFHPEKSGEIGYEILQNLISEIEE